MTGTNLWDQVLSRIETKVNRHSFYTWFKPTAYVDERDEAVRVKVPNALFRDWLTKHYSAVIQEALAELNHPMTAVSYVTDEGPAVVPPEPPAVSLPETIEEAVEEEGALSARYSFDTFVVGPSNQFAHAACRAVAEAPSRS
jgi:chromosomal replication initiator protein